ncbi:MAG: PmeII family type II restriction endonuclease [Methanoregula sp.]
MAKKPAQNPFYDLCRTKNHVFNPTEINYLFTKVSQERVERIARDISTYIEVNLPNHFNKREALSDYRTNPYVLMTSSSALDLENPDKFANFVFNTKFYMALETSFGKSIESIFVKHYPFEGPNRWSDPPEKLAEFAALVGLTRQEKTRERTRSVWREIDKSVVVGDRRYLTTIKSGPNTINDSQVSAMNDAIVDHYKEWMDHTRRNHPGVNKLDVVIGLTYGTDRTTNNKENQILVKLLESGFVEEDRERYPGVLIDSETRSVRVYRRIGRDFWSLFGDPVNPNNAQFVFLEILLGLARALSVSVEGGTLEAGIKRKMADLSAAMLRLSLPDDSCLPDWVSRTFSEKEMFWLTTAMTAFFDEGI